MNRILLFFPFGYFLKTRLNTKPAILFHGYAEYLLGILLLIYSGIPPLSAIVNFIAAYLAFISVYEIGYIINDFVSVKYEINPRKRLGVWNPTPAIIYSWIGIRIASFLFFAYLLNQLSSPVWWGFYLILSFVFFLHNVLRKKGYKIFTFISLAFLRFYAPLFPLVENIWIAQTYLAILLFYVFFRTLTYIDSKGLLVIPDRASFHFKVAYYLILLPLSSVITLLTNSFICLWLNLYFLMFWSLLYLANKGGVILGNDIKTEG